jgi:hypothetical protein
MDFTKHSKYVTLSTLHWYQSSELQNDLIFDKLLGLTLAQQFFYRRLVEEQIKLITEL